MRWRKESQCWLSVDPARWGWQLPVAIMVGNGKGARQIMFKTAVSLELRQDAGVL